ncbi:MAG: hypothetical protein AUG51_16225 [Acidobacteria bacterium 13_1_20CM_3_53_8]|nr:MAG: hypothetical protein AUG51_16225 [Acidobacteria bacterium 13_1_20CM_3_53_8]
MHKHSLFFAKSEECINAEWWIMGNIEGIEDHDVSYDGTVFFFYTAFALSEQQQHIIASTVAPLSFLSEEL